MFHGSTSSEIHCAAHGLVVEVAKLRAGLLIAPRVRDVEQAIRSSRSTDRRARSRQRRHSMGPPAKTETCFILGWRPRPRSSALWDMASRARPAAAPADHSRRTASRVLRTSREPDFRQERSRRSYLALDRRRRRQLFATHGYDAVGTPEIAQRAGVSVGTFYRYFDDKHEIYLEIARRTMVAAYRETDRGLDARAVRRPRAPRDDQRDRSRSCSTTCSSRPQLTRSFQEMSLRDAEVAELRARSSRSRSSGSRR